MTLYVATKIALILSGSRLGVAFKPFLGVEELRPTNPTAFCKDSTETPGLQHCERKIQRELSDGGIVTMDWAMSMDPSKILSLDTESEKGVRLLACSQDSLELEIPETHKSFIKEGKFIVGSHFLHNCEHLKGDLKKGETHEHLYARIEAAERMEGKNKVKVYITELPTVAHVADKVHAYFEWSPAEARDLSPFPERRTNAPPLMVPERDDEEEQGPHQTRKLEMEGSWGNPTVTHSHKGGFGAYHSLLDFVPEQVSNLGWNWDFWLNSTSTPQVNYSLPGGEGSIMLRHPYIKAHAGFYFNFTSNLLKDFSKPPDVKFKFGLRGHGFISGKMYGELRYDDSVAGDPFNRHELPILKKLSQTLWLGAIEFSIGQIPISLMPGVQFSAKAYHMGRFLGSLQFGIHTHFVMNPEIKFDTDTGMESSWVGEFIDTQLWPPSWLIYTNRFEMGVLLEPQLWIKGRMGSVKDAMWGLSLKPYFNISIIRSGIKPWNVPDFGHELVIYPFRVTGLDGDDTYLVEVEANGKKAQTSVQMNFGILEYHDRPEAFQFGHITQHALLQEPIKVTLKKGNSTVQTEVGSGTAYCTELLNGECVPSPLVVGFTGANGEKVNIDLTVIYKKDPLPWFASKIRGVGISFPRIDMREDIMKSLTQELVTSAGSINLRVTRSGHIYDIPMTVNMTQLQLEGSTKLLGNKMLEMGPNFLDAWQRCEDAIECQAPTIALMRGEELLGSNSIPEIPWGSAHHAGTQMTTYRGGFDMGTMHIPVHLALFAPENQFDSIGTATMEVEVSNPTHAAFFVFPIGAQTVEIGGSQSLIWSVGDSKVNVITFALTAMKVINSKYVPMADWSDLFAAQCSFNSVGAEQSFHSADEPCTFEHLIIWNETHFTRDDSVVLRVEWQEMEDTVAVTHELFSPPFLIGGHGAFIETPTNDKAIPKVIESDDVGAKAYCKANEGMEQYQENCNMMGEDQCRLQSICEWENARRLTTMSEMWMEHMNELKAEDCTDNNLTFSMGAGLYIKSTLKHLTVPDKFPVLGGIAEAPDITSGYVSLTPNGPMINETFADLFPEELCADGMCAGELPGCPSNEHDMRAYPRIPFYLDRNFSFYRKSSKSIQHLIAYAFSVLPEVVDVTVASVAEHQLGAMYACIARPGMEAFAQACSTVPREACLHHVRCEWADVSKPTTTTPPLLETAYGSYATPSTSYAPPLLPVVTTTTAAANWFGRLLTPETEEEAFQTDRLEISFNGGLPYIVDKQLMEVLIRHGAFDDIGDADGKGPMNIVQFDVSHDVRAGLNDKDPYADEDNFEEGASSYMESRAQFSIGLVVFLMAVALVVGFVVRTRKQYRRIRSTEAHLEEGTSAIEEAPETQRYERAESPPSFVE